jgi:O-antigen/teichoic acid export membrane protein
MSDPVAVVDPVTTEVDEPATPPADPRGSAAGVAGAGIVGQAITFLVAPLLARVLGPAGRGTLALLGIYDELSTNLFNAGVPSAVGVAAKDGRASVPALLGATRRFTLLLLPVSVLAGAAVARWPLHDLSTDARVVGFLLVALSPVANTFFIACRNLLMARGDLVTLRTLPLVQAISRAAGLLALIALGWLSPAVAAAVLSASVLLANGLAWRRVGARPAEPAPLAPLIGFGLRSLPGTLSNLANNRLDQLLIAPMLGTRALGIYAVAIGITFIPVQVGAGLAYAAFRHVRAGDTSGRHSPAATALRRACLLVGAACAVTAVGALGGLQLLYGHDFASALGPTLLLLPSSLFLGLHLVANQVANALDRPEHASIGQVVGVVVTVAGLLVVLPGGGIGGAAIVSSLASAARYAVTVVLLRRVGVRGTIPGWRDVREAGRDGGRLVWRLRTRARVARAEAGATRPG